MFNFIINKLFTEGPNIICQNLESLTLISRCNEDVLQEGQETV